MIYKITIALGLLLTSPAAFACAPPANEGGFSGAEISKMTYERIKRSVAIIDATVARDKAGTFFLKPLRVWKGQPHRFYYIANSGCDISLSPGTKVRALLEGDASGWMMMAPLYDRRTGTRLFDSIVDAHLRNARPKGFENGGLPFPPLP
ncbi:hypothetical protein SAMIE_1035520 [Sphingobium amiense]|uniref:Uncharacterized protein n=1 Tax=Sphingobium amiense TaxID=135719 RepID=A0A494W735_9SPHN|nr:hypothetical protein [Sphingobium amiense]BBE00052.1 hypothetical protein SAMIE_1035520 [Sphingobium amiense]